MACMARLGEAGRGVHVQVLGITLGMLGKLAAVGREAKQMFCNKMLINTLVSYLQGVLVSAKVDLQFGNVFI